MVPVQLGNMPGAVVEAIADMGGAKSLLDLESAHITGLSVRMAKDQEFGTLWSQLHGVSVHWHCNPPSVSSLFCRHCTLCEGIEDYHPPQANIITGGRCAMLRAYELGFLQSVSGE